VDDQHVMVRLSAVSTVVLSVGVLFSLLGAVSGCGASHPTATALAVRVTFVGPAMNSPSAKDVVRVASGTSCHAWLLDALSHGGTDFVVKLLVTPSDAERVKTELSALRNVRGVAEISRTEFSETPPADPGFRVTGLPCA
jgi:hypothetical protein